MLIAFVCLLAILLAGAIYQYISVKEDFQNNPPLGKLITINGHNMHIYGQGEGVPTVVITTGLGTPCMYYYPLVEKISKYTRTVIYERPGYGWSEITNLPRKITTITHELYLLLEKSGEKPPYILVGHSMGSLEVIHFSQLYPKLVAGVVLLDAGNPVYYQTVKASVLQKVTFVPMFYIGRILWKIGIIRLLSKIGMDSGFKSISDHLPDNIKEAAKVVFYNHNNFNKNILDEFCAINSNGGAVADFGPIGDIPIVILTAEESANKVKGWRDSQEQCTRWSATSKHQIVKDASHGDICYKHEDIIVNEIMKIVYPKNLI